MRKIVAWILSLALLLAAAPAWADGKLEIVQENMQVYKPYVFVYAKIKNTGDAPVEISSQVELFDTEDELFRSEGFTVLGDVLAPGESTYAYYGVYLYGDTNVRRFTSEWEGVRPSGMIQTIRYPSHAELSLADADHDEDCILIFFTNTTDETVFTPSASGVLLDGEGNILCITVPIQYDLGITPGSTVIFKYEIPPYVMKHIDPENLILDSVVYTAIEEW